PLLPAAATAVATPGQFPYQRGTVGQAQPWLIAQRLEGGQPDQLNAQLRHDLALGQTAVFWPPEAHFTAHDLRTLFQNVDLAQTPLLLPCLSSLPVLAQLAAAHEADLPQLRGALLHDPIALLTMTSQPLDALYDQTAVLTRWAVQHAPQLHTLAVMPTLYQECGAHAVQQLGLMLATAVYHIRQLQQRGVTVEEIGGRITAVFSIGSDFFMEMAKLRAARAVWAQMMAAFGGDAAAQKLTIHARTSDASKSQLDPHVNLLRATTEAFAAALGGADSLEIAPFDANQRPANDFSRRIARNVQIILQEEVNLTKLLDPAGGSYTVEYLTDELAQRGWALFQEIEAAGGMVAVLQAGTLQQQIAATAAARQADLATRKAVMVGTNIYPNFGEKPLPQPEPVVDEIPLTRQPDPQLALAALAQATPENVVPLAITAAQAGATLAQLQETLVAGAEMVEVEGIRPFHPAAPFVQLRRWADAYAQTHGHPPQIFLANMGPLRQHKARAEFTRGFFEVGGFALIDSPGFDSPQMAAQAALDSGASVTVICSTDDTYPEIVPSLVKGIKTQQPAALVILAGYPKEQIEAHKAAGVDAFIHLGADCLALNRRVQEKLA
ncbi:MAG: methylmalonyl-CoA mutase family protein, partial [Candidatus Promineifilaceae bacterium]